MNKYLKISLALCTAAVLALSCEEKEEETTTNYFSGSLKFNMPSYVLKGQTFDLVPSGAKRDDDGDYRVYWKLLSSDSRISRTDTTKAYGEVKDGRYKLVVPDTLCSFTVTCYYNAVGYSAASCSKKFVVVDADRENGSLKGLQLRPDDFVFVDVRDGLKYNCTTVGKTDWFRENLAYVPKGKAFLDADAMSKVAGRFYTWSEAKVACPTGWRLPSQDDWMAAAQAAGAQVTDKNSTFKACAGLFMADIYFNGAKMWEFWPDVKVTDKTGISIFPFGYALVDGSDYSFRNYQDYSAHWTADESDDEYAYYRYIFVQKPDLYTGTALKDGFAAQVRCVRDRV